MSTGHRAARAITLERAWEAGIEEVWGLWTTPGGIESWWGPDGFAVTVHVLDLRPGGELRYAMTAVAPEMAAFMEREGMPTTTEHSARFTDVVPPLRLGWVHATDFVPGVAPYEVGSLLELSQDGPLVRLRLTLEPMHDAEWTARAAAGWAQELDALGRLIAGGVAPA